MPGIYPHVDLSMDRPGMTPRAVGGGEVLAGRWEAFMGNRCMAGDAFLRALGQVMDSVALFAFQFFFGMGACPIHFNGRVMT